MASGESKVPYPQQQQQQQVPYPQQQPVAFPPPQQPGDFGVPPPAYNAVVPNVVIHQPGAPVVNPAPPVIVQQLNVQFGTAQVRTNCPYCQAEITTSVKTELGCGAWLWCCILSWFCCICGCCLIPFCIDGTKVHNHHCPNCKQLVGQYRGSQSCT